MSCRKILPAESSISSKTSSMNAKRLILALRLKKSRCILRRSRNRAVKNRAKEIKYSLDIGMVRGKEEAGAIRFVRVRGPKGRKLLIRLLMPFQRSLQL